MNDEKIVPIIGKEPNGDFQPLEMKEKIK